MNGKVILLIFLGVVLVGLLAIATAGSAVLAVNLRASKEQLRRAEARMRELEQLGRQAEARARTAEEIISIGRQFAEFEGKLIREFEVRGAGRTGDDNVRKMVRAGIGRPFKGQEWVQDKVRLIQSGFFDEVILGKPIAVKDGLKLAVEVVEKPMQPEFARRRLDRPERIDRYMPKIPPQTVKDEF